MTSSLTSRFSWAGLLEQGLGLLGIVLVDRGCLVVGRVVLRQVGGQRLSVAAQLVLDQLVVIDGVMEGLTDALVVEGLLLAVEHQEADAVAVDAVDGDACADQLVDVGERDVLAGDGGTLLQGGHASGVVNAHEPLHGVGGSRLRAVVLGVGDEVQLAAILAVALAEGPCTGAGRRGGHGLLGDLGSWEDAAQGQALFELLVAVDERVGQREGHGGVVLGGNGLDEGQHVLVGGVGLVGLDNGHDVGGGSRPRRWRTWRLCAERPRTRSRRP